MVTSGALGQALLGEERNKDEKTFGEWIPENEESANKNFQNQFNLHFEIFLINWKAKIANNKRQNQTLFFFTLPAFMGLDNPGGAERVTGSWTSCLVSSEAAAADDIKSGDFATDDLWQEQV